jgi:hypothetical protein
MPDINLAEQRVLGRLIGEGKKGLTPIEIFDLIFSVGLTENGNLGATPNLAFNSSWQHAGTVNVSITGFNLVDPTVPCFCRILLTKSDDVTERTIVWHADTGLDHAANWMGGNQLTSMGIIPRQRYLVTLWRYAVSSYLGLYSDWGVAP